MIDGWNQVRAVTMFHETYHWQDVSWPTCDANEEYRPEYIAARVRINDKNADGYEFNIRNAHS